ncbi:MAG: hypothetical protein CLLPBCKN_007579 [Chroococcidiopsis cubana SAG 39.79]|uniref:Knr4/Smi1-like domain-containing protein n=1 Tax=Chroococcidiopsis cubana SAG 39.79 TaxID=388085 RepID=A0AB37UT59_9CYAN|nr:hypothetical protein [Chroococcidiopsis cubana]MDZ4878144.1 hypothetical protein [Chroococcidiopsis cubana SAG 39.79]PSB65783.1 hypothetical protein C7B79_03970 [Chroococcidiopsis cubana CCALA 043]RUT14588.1 hypothetical protein DSM107010_01340 [Chroococcidiopsis cubana SAG 39.79]
MHVVSASLSSFSQQILQYRTPVSITDALEYLQDLACKTQLLHLYQQVFPQEWQASKIPLDRRTFDSVYCDKEIEFLHLVNEQLFAIELWEEFETTTSREYEIPILPKTNDWWYEDLEDLEDCDQFLLSLLGFGYDLEVWEQKFGFTPEQLPRADTIDLERFQQLCAEQPHPLCYLSDAIALIDKSTGCIWCDVSTEVCESLPWTYENIMFLAEQWKIANSYWDKAAALGEWIERDVAHRKAAFGLWNCATPSKP